MAILKNKKIIVLYLLGISILLGMSSYITPMHKYYLSITEVNIDSKKHTLDISSKLFIDDLELELSKKSKQKVDLSTTPRNEDMNQLLFDYLNSNLKINVGGKLLKLEYVGYEIENEAVWCYMEVHNFKGKGTVSVLNSLLYSSFADQTNLINVSWDKVVKTARLSNPEKFAEFKYE